MNAIGTIQMLFDNYLRTHVLKQVLDIQYDPTSEEVIVIRRGLNRRNQIIDVSGCASPSEVYESVLSRAAIY